jgi:hypothetical protein
MQGLSPHGKLQLLDENGVVREFYAVDDIGFANNNEKKFCKSY